MRARQVDSSIVAVARLILPLAAWISGVSACGSDRGTTSPTLDFGDASLAVDGSGDASLSTYLSAYDGPASCRVSVRGGAGVAGGVTLAPACVPGSTRWCDDGSCYWGKQKCKDDGAWGGCHDTSSNIGPSGCVGINYDENCCAASGQCCAHALGGNNYGSIGSCDAVDPCACHDLCAQGAMRWCSNGSGAAWGTQGCGANGLWEACTKTSSAPRGCSSTVFDPDCCIASGACCEALDSEGSDPISWNCPATDCSEQWTPAGGYDAGDYLEAGLPFVEVGDDDAGEDGGEDATTPSADATSTQKHDVPRQARRRHTQ